jgi:hypothetical protein
VYYHYGLSSAASTSETRSTSRIGPGPGPGYNETVESWFDFEVWSTAAAARTTAIADDELPFSASTISGREHSGGTAFVIYGKNPGGTKHTQLTKPFIISEGYNLYDIAEELRECNNPNNDIEDFFNKVSRAYTGNFDFQSQLLNAGYDIVYIDNAKGTDDIVRNAHLFEDVVRWVNQNKVGGTATGAKNVVMGQSMGGLVSRYGLAEMAKRPNNSDDPHTRLLILHDSPQRGANNPVGVQSLTRSFDVPFLFGYTVAGLLKGKIGATLKVLNQPATQQLSILNAFDGRSTIRANTFIPNTYQPKITFSGPPPYDVVAVSNGSQCGQGQNTPAGVALAESSLAMLLPAPFFSIPLTSAAAGVTGDFASYGLPAYGQQRTISRVDMRLEYRINIGYCPFCVSIPIRFHLLRESATSPANTLPLETLPGGATNPYQQAGDCADGFDLGSLHGVYAAFFRTTVYNGDICFVPSYSSLDVTTVTPATAFSKYINDATNNPSRPNVRRYIAQERMSSSTGTQFNVPHISFTPRNSEWIFNEMQGTTNAQLNCQTECNPYPPIPVSGPDIVCAGSTGATFTVAPPFGSVTGWTASSAGLVNLPTTTAGATSITITPASSSSTGLVTLTAQISNGCYSTVATRQVAVGEGLLVINDGAAPDRCPARGMEFALTAAYGAQGAYTWSVSHGYIRAGQGTTHISVSGLPDQDYYMQVHVSAAAACPGAMAIEQDYLQHVYATAPGGIGMCDLFRSAAPIASLYPNPAKETVDVHIDNASAAAPVTVRLFDSYEQARTEQTSHGETTLRLNTGKLPTGLYFVHILRGREVLSRQQLRIEK